MSSTAARSCVAARCCAAAGTSAPGAAGAAGALPAAGQALLDIERSEWLVAESGRRMYWDTIIIFVFLQLPNGGKCVRMYNIHLHF